MDAERSFSQRDARGAAGFGGGAGPLIGPGAQVREAWLGKLDRRCRYWAILQQQARSSLSRHRHALAR